MKIKQKQKQISENAICQIRSTDQTHVWWGISSHTQPKRYSLILPFLAIFMQKIQDINWFLRVTLMIKESNNLTWQEPNMLPSLDKYLHAKNLRYCWSRNTTIWLDGRRKWQQQPKSGTLRRYLPLLNIYIQKNYDIDWLFPEISAIKKSFNAIGKEIRLAAPKQKW